MNLYIMVDLEGISGIYSPEQVMPGRARFDEGRRYMTREVNLCVEACHEAGAKEIYVRDCHAGSFTLLWEELSPHATKYICGATGDTRFPGLERCDGVILLGYHAMAGTAGAILEHSMSSAGIQNYWINGAKAGEVAIDAGIAGEQGKPVLLVSGDDHVCAEARTLMPWVETAVVKRGITAFGGELLPPGEAARRLTQGVQNALSRMDEMRPLVYAPPVRLRVEVTERTQLPNAAGKPYLHILDGRTYEVEGSSLEEAFWRSL